MTNQQNKFFEAIGMGRLTEECESISDKLIVMARVIIEEDSRDFRLSHIQMVHKKELLLRQAIWWNIETCDYLDGCPLEDEEYEQQKIEFEELTQWLKQATGLGFEALKKVYLEVMEGGLSEEAKNTVQS